MPLAWLKKLSDEAGTVAMIFALSIIPIVAMADFAIDLPHTVKKKQKIQLINDSAVLAAAQIEPIGGSMICEAANSTAQTTREAVSASVNCLQMTALMRVIGQDKMDFRAASAAEYGIDNLDGAFRFDVSGSMNSSRRLTNLKAAAKQAVDILLPPDASEKLIENTRLARGSYNTMVNVGDDFENVTGVPSTRTYSIATSISDLRISL